MAKRTARIRQAEIVGLFASRLRELRKSHGTTQAELAREAHVTVSYVWRLESAGAAPGIDLVARLASALGTTPTELMPTAAPADALPVLQQQAAKLSETLLRRADRETLLMLNSLLACIVESLARRG
jgi:transcriptional regulator with XRE-family HTH domain